MSGLVRLVREGARLRMSLNAESEEVSTLAVAVLANGHDTDVFSGDLGRRLAAAPGAGALG
jgi:hypothetical protein